VEHLPWDGDLGHLEGDVAAVADDLRANLDRLVFQARQRPVFDRLWRRQRGQEVAEIVGNRMKLEPHRVPTHAKALLSGRATCPLIDPANVGQMRSYGPLRLNRPALRIADPSVLLGAANQLCFQRLDLCKLLKQLFIFELGCPKSHISDSPFH
jgi:hypothetical protein